MTWEYSEDNIIELTAIDLFLNELGYSFCLQQRKL